MYEALAGLDSDAHIVPVLAESWSEDGDRTWVFSIRHGVRFHDGAELTASEVKRAIERSLQSPRLRRWLEPVDGLTVNGEHELRITTHRSEPLLIDRLAQVLIARPGGAAGRFFVGTGPYRPVVWKKGERLQLEAFGDYWRGRPAIDRVVFVAVATPGEERAHLSRAEVDIQRLATDLVLPASHTEVTRASLGCVYLWFDSQTGPFSDRRVRQAVSFAIDRDGLAPMLGEAAVPLHQLMSPAVFGYDDELAKIPHDRAKARQLLEQAGLGKGFDVALTYVPGGSITAAVAERIQRFLGEIGIRARLETTSWDDLVARWEARRLPFFLSGWSFQSGDAFGFYFDCLATRRVAAGAGAFNPGFSSPRFDRLIAEQASTFEAASRLTHYRELAIAGREEMPIVPLYWPRVSYAVAKGLRWKPRLDGGILANEMQWVTPPRP
jgi:peptide/nickel transport system substrate-binding protein